jgi:hypothetical protein
MAKRRIEDFIVPNGVAGGFGQPIMQMLQIQPFRQALKAKAPAKTWQELSDSMPQLRITAATEQVVADQPTMSLGLPAARLEATTPSSEATGSSKPAKVITTEFSTSWS